MRPLKVCLTCRVDEEEEEEEVNGEADADKKSKRRANLGQVARQESDLDLMHESKPMREPWKRAVALYTHAHTAVQKVENSL